MNSSGNASQVRPPIALATKLVGALRDCSWLGFFGMLFAVYLFGKIVVLVSGQPILVWCRHALLLILVLIKTSLEIPPARLRAHEAAARGGSRAVRLAALLPDDIRGLLRLDRMMWKGFILWLRRRAPAPRPEGIRIDFLKRSSYSAVVPLILIALFVEIPVCAFVVGLIEADPAKRLVVHVVMAIAVTYSFIWVCGDRWLVNHSYHVRTGNEFDLLVGERSSGSIPLDAIETVQVLKSPRQEWCAERAVRMRDTVHITPFDQANVVLTLKPDMKVPINHFQVPRQVRYVFLYVDDPRQLVRVLGNL